MWPAPRIIAIDDNPLHLAGLVDGLNRCGAACMPIHFTGTLEGLSQYPQVRVIFADLHLDETGAGAGDGDHARHFAVIGGFLEETVAPAGPYMIVLWTMYPDQAASLHAYLEQRLVGVAAPYATVALDKAQHLDGEGRVIDPASLIGAIGEIVRGEPQIAALLEWEERVLGAAAETVSSIMQLAGTATDRRPRLRRLLYHIAAGAVGSGNVFGDRFRAVNEALLPILADRGTPDCTSGPL